MLFPITFSTFVFLLRTEQTADRHICQELILTLKMPACINVWEMRLLSIVVAVAVVSQVRYVLMIILYIHV